MEYMNHKEIKQEDMKDVPRDLEVSVTREQVDEGYQWKIDVCVSGRFARTWVDRSDWRDMVLGSIDLASAEYVQKETAKAIQSVITEQVAQKEPEA